MPEILNEILRLCMYVSTCTSPFWHPSSAVETGHIQLLRSCKQQLANSSASPSTNDPLIHCFLKLPARAKQSRYFSPPLL